MKLLKALLASALLGLASTASAGWICDPDTNICRNDKMLENPPVIFTKDTSVSFPVYDVNTRRLLIPIVQVLHTEAGTHIRRQELYSVQITLNPNGTYEVDTINREYCGFSPVTMPCYIYSNANRL